MTWPLWAGSPLIPKPFLGAVQDSFSGEGVLGELECRKGRAWIRKELPGKGGGSGTPGAAPNMS